MTMIEYSHQAVRILNERQDFLYQLFVHDVKSVDDKNNDYDHE